MNGFMDLKRLAVERCANENPRETKVAAAAPDNAKGTDGRYDTPAASRRVWLYFGLARAARELRADSQSQ